MSETPPASDWWQASDGRWYPPQTYPHQAGQQSGPYQSAPHQPGPNQPDPRQSGPYQSAPAPAGTPWPGPAFPGPASGPAQDLFPPLPAPGRPRRPRRTGWLVALLVTGLILVLVVVAGSYLVRLAARSVGEHAVRITGTGACGFLDEAQAGRALGVPVKVVAVGGIFSGVMAALDDRALPNAPTCYALITTNGTRVARVARLEQANAAQLFAADLRTARRTPPNRVRGNEVLSFDRAVSGLGDQAFCTGPDPSGSSGVLVRHGRVLVYVTFSVDVTDALDSAGSSSTRASPFGAATTDANCELSGRLARVALVG